MLTITPVATGSALITVTANDGEATATQTVMATVEPEPNRAPTVVTLIPAQTVTVGLGAGTVALGSYFNDPNGDVLTYMATSSNIGAATASVLGSTLSVTPIALGATMITVVAADMGGLSATQTFAVTVNPQPNRAPTTAGTIPTQNLTVGGSTGTLNLGSYFSDPDGDALAYSASTDDTSIAAVNLSGATMIITPIGTGKTTVTASATDPDGLSGTQSFTVKVNQSSQTLITIGVIGTITLTAGGGAAEMNIGHHFSNLNGGALTYAAVSSDTAVVTVSLSGTTLSITPITAGTATVQVIAADSEGSSATQTIPVVVNPQPNRAPVTVVSIGSVEVTERGDAATIDLANHFSDPDGDALTYTATLLYHRAGNSERDRFDRNHHTRC